MPNRKKINGQWIQVRGSNKKYPILDDLDALFEMLKVKTKMQVAKELGVPFGSLNYIINKYFPEEWLKLIRIQRRPHRKYRRSATEIK